jgi:hypothetical protein
MEPKKLAQSHLNQLKATQLHSEKEFTKLYIVWHIIILQCHGFIMGFLSQCNQVNLNLTQRKWNSNHLFVSLNIQAQTPSVFERTTLVSQSL